MKYILILLLVIWLFSCNDEKEKIVNEENNVQNIEINNNSIKNEENSENEDIKDNKMMLYEFYKNKNTKSEVDEKNEEDWITKEKILNIWINFYKDSYNKNCNNIYKIFYWTIHSIEEKDNINIDELLSNERWKNEFCWNITDIFKDNKTFDDYISNYEAKVYNYEDYLNWKVAILNIDTNDINKYFSKWDYIFHSWDDNNVSNIFNRDYAKWYRSIVFTKYNWNYKIKSLGIIINDNWYKKLNEFYSIDNKNVFYRNIIINWVDLKSFKSLNLLYWKDNSKVYYWNSILKWADTDTFKVLEIPYARDKNIFYYQSKPFWVKIDDLEWHKVLNDIYSKDKNWVYYAWNGPIQWVDVKSFIAINKSYWKDNNNCFHWPIIVNMGVCDKLLK